MLLSAVLAEEEGAGRSHSLPAPGVARGGWSGLPGPRKGSQCQGFDVHRTEGLLRAGRGQDF